MVGSLFAQAEDSSSLDLLILRTSESYSGEYISIDEKYIYFKPIGYLVEQPVEKSRIEKVTLSNGTVIYDYVKSIDTFTPKTLTEADVKNIAKKPIVGGIFIAIGGGILISQNETEYEDIGNFEKFKTTTTIAYALITIGGVLIALGI